MNNTNLRLMYKVFLLLITVCILASCEDDNNKLLPGSYVEQDLIQTFPGDTVWISGTASNYAGLESIKLNCEAWGINKVYNLKSQEPTVFNYQYKLAIPEDAIFDEKLTVVVRDVNGSETIRTIVLEYVADMQAPVMDTKLPDQISADFDTSLGKGVWNLDIKFSDDRMLKEIQIQIPAININEVIALSGRTGELKQSFEFPNIGSFLATIILKDAANNETIVQTTVIVMMNEEEDPYQNYAQMYIVNANENENNYVNGFYRYMDRTGEYQYLAKYYAPSDNTAIYFVPTKEMDKDLFGVSPYVSSKLMNKNGYVNPVILPKRGYYTIWIDLNAHIYSISEYTIPSGTYTGTLLASGTGFTMGDWALSGEMTLVNSQNPYQKEVALVLVDGYAGDYQYYFTSPDWSRIFRSDTEGKWWFEAASGACIIYKPNYAGKVKVIFDTAALWGTIKKVTE